MADTTPSRFELEIKHEKGADFPILEFGEPGVVTSVLARPLYMGLSDPNSLDVTIMIDPDNQAYVESVGSLQVGSQIVETRLVGLVGKVLGFEIGQTEQQKTYGMNHCTFTEAFDYIRGIRENEYTDAHAATLSERYSWMEGYNFYSDPLWVAVYGSGVHREDWFERCSVFEHGRDDDDYWQTHGIKQIPPASFTRAYDAIMGSPSNPKPTVFFEELEGITNLVGHGSD